MNKSKSNFDIIYLKILMNIFYLQYYNFLNNKYKNDI